MDCCFPDVSSETMDIWWTQLKEDNKKFLEKRAQLKMPFFAAPEKMVKQICNIGQYFGLSRDIILSAVMLFDRFMSSSYDTVSEETSKIKRNQIMESLKDKIIFTICSCLQLSSKALGQHQVLVSDINRFMTENHKNVTSECICKSEQTVFKILQYKVPAYSPLIYTETLVHQLPVKKLNLECKLLEETCAQFMMVAYCHHQALYDSLYYVLTSKESCCFKDRLEFLCVEMDRLFLCGAAVLAAVRTLGVSGSWVERRLQHLTRVPARELQRLSAILCDIATDPAGTDD